MRVQLHRKCVGEEEEEEEEEGRGWCAAAGESHCERGNKENKNMKGMNTGEIEWMGKTQRATGVKRVEMRFQH